jgi:hypothetical protein
MIYYKLILKYDTPGLTAELKLKPIDEILLRDSNIAYNNTDSIQIKNEIIKRLVNYFIVNDGSVDTNKLYNGHMLSIFQAGCEISGYKWEIT